MSTPESLEPLAGSWTGTSRLWNPWATPAVSDSASTATVALTARGKFLTIDYTWETDGKPQQGFLLLGRETKTDVVHAVWVDSYHMSNEPMICQGRVLESGEVEIVGSYAAPPGPDWRWRTVLTAAGDSAFHFVMFNISPEGEEDIAFENRYERSA